jgi:hypothetical protein
MANKMMVSCLGGKKGVTPDIEPRIMIIIRGQRTEELQNLFILLKSLHRQWQIKDFRQLLRANSTFQR